MKAEHLAYIFVVVMAILSSCAVDTDSVGGSDSGTGGSMARFTVVGDHLFTVDQTNLKVFDISQAILPRFINDVPVGLDVETIFPFRDKLYLGTETGMYIYDVSTPERPREVSYYQHVVACDPVVSDGEFAFVTLNSFSDRCWRSTNELQIVSLENLSNPTLIAQYPMTNPRGLALDNDILWVCDDGLRVFDVNDKTKLVELNHFTDLLAYDLILHDDRALVIGETGFVQYKIEADTIVKLSEINVGY